MQSSQERGPWSLVSLHHPNSNASVISLLKSNKIRLSDVFTNRQNNRRMLEEFKQEGIIQELESSPLENEHITPADFAIKFLDLIETRHDVVAAVNLLCNLSDQLLNYRRSIHQIFQQGEYGIVVGSTSHSINVTLDNEKRNSRFEHSNRNRILGIAIVEDRHHGITSERIQVLNNDRNEVSPPDQFELKEFHSNSPDEANASLMHQDRAINTEEDEDSKHGYFHKCRSSVLSAGILLLGIAIGIFVGITLFWLIGYHNVKTIANASSCIQESTILESRLQDNFSVLQINWSTSQPAVKTRESYAHKEEETTASISQNIDKILNTTSTPSSTTTDYLPSGYIKPLEYQNIALENCISVSVKHPNELLSSLCNVRMCASVTINFVNHFEWNNFKMDCKNPAIVVTLNIKGSPSLRNINELLKQISHSMRQLKISDCDKITRRNTVGSALKLQFLRSLEIISGQILSGCNEVFSYLAENLKFSDLGELTLREIWITDSNNVEIGHIILGMSRSPLLITFKEVKLESEIDTQSNSLIIDRFRMSLHNSSKNVEVACKTFVNFISKSAYNQVIMASAPLVERCTCTFSQSQTLRVMIQNLTLTIDVKRSINILDVSFLNKFVNSQFIEMRLTGWPTGTASSPSLTVTGYENLHSDLNVLNILFNFKVKLSGSFKYCQEFEGKNIYENTIVTCRKVIDDNYNKQTTQIISKNSKTSAPRNKHLQMGAFIG